MLDFKNPEINKGYQINGTADQVVQTPDGYTGNLSEVSNPAILDGMIARNSNLVSKRTPAPAPAKGNGGAQS